MIITGCRLYFLRVKTRVPYKFGTETFTEAVCARVCLSVRDPHGRVAEGWGETPLNVGWVWPSLLPYSLREEALSDFCRTIAGRWMQPRAQGHPLEVGHAFLQSDLLDLLSQRNSGVQEEARMPWLAALVCASPFDLALYDAFGKLVGRPVYETLDCGWLERDLASFLEPASDAQVSFKERYPADYLVPPVSKLPAWHSVGSLDPLEAGEVRDAPDDGYPVLLEDWIVRDGLFCLKVKLKGNDADWDYHRLTKIGAIGRRQGVRWLCADYNCTAESVEYVTDMLDRLRIDDPLTFAMLLYVEQPFAYQLEERRLDVHAISARKPLFMDESAHDWKVIRFGRELGWNNVALKTCKTQTEALLSLCWARAHGMTLMVQDLTNPMLAFIPHASLAAHAGTIMGLECNAPQYYPQASAFEARVHPDLYARRDGYIDLSSIKGPGFGYRIEEIGRPLPPEEVVA
jgi:L-alanine-DL-glutamate epimerase-like enolase superfamily enzyme